MTTNRDADEDDETFTVALDTANLPSSVAAGTPSSVQVTISDDDGGADRVPGPGPGPAASSDASLNGLTISAGKLAFDSETTANDAGATVRVNGAAVASGSASAAIALEAGENVIEVLLHGRPRPGVRLDIGGDVERRDRLEPKASALAPRETAPRPARTPPASARSGSAPRRTPRTSP